MFALQRTSYHMWCCNISVVALGFVCCVVKSQISLIQNFRHIQIGDFQPRASTWVGCPCCRTKQICDWFVSLLHLNMQLNHCPPSTSKPQSKQHIIYSILCQFNLFYFRIISTVLIEHFKFHFFLSHFLLILN